MRAAAEVTIAQAYAQAVGNDLYGAIRDAFLQLDGYLPERQSLSWQIRMAW